MIINAISNGVPGNNSEVGVPRYDSVDSLFDSNPDTWWEYEAPVGSDFAPPLVLSLTIKLKVPTIINSIRLTPINFGTRDWVKINDIATSEADDEYFSIKDNSYIPDWTVEGEEEFILSPASGKYSGVANFSFAPRRAQYVKVVLIQEAAYPVTTHFGSRDRWAIGLRDIEIGSFKYQSQSDFVSKEIVISDAIRKIALVTNQEPLTNNVLAGIDHYISVDGGKEWNQITPLQEVPTENKPEILNINLDTESNSVSTDSPVNACIYKATLYRNTDGFTPSNAPLTTATTTELLSMPSKPPYNIKLSNAPIDGTIRVVNPAYGNIGDMGAPLSLGKVTDTETPQLDVDVDGDLTKNMFALYVGKTLWSEVDWFSDAHPTSKYFVTDIKNNKIKFGDDTNGRIPDTNKTITAKFYPERVYVDNNRFTTRFPTSGIADDLLLYNKGNKVEGLSTDKMAKYATRHKLSYAYITTDSGGDLEISITVSSGTPASFDASPVDYIDGTEEFDEELSSAWSVDTINGIVYTKSVTSSDFNADITYSYVETNSIPQEYLSFDDSDADFKEIIVEDGQIKTMPLVNTLADSGPVPAVPTYVTNYRNAIVGGYVWPLYNSLETSNLQLTPGYQTGSANGDHYFYAAQCLVPKSVIVTESDGTPVSSLVGEIRFVDGKTEFDNLQNPTGLYSVDYRNGVVYFYDTAIASNWMIQADYTHYYLEYRMGKAIDGFSLGEDGKSLTFDDQFMLDNPNLSNTVRVSYDYAETDQSHLAELEPYFSPILKDYCLQVVTTSGLRDF